MSLSAKVAYNTLIQIISKVISTFLGLAVVAIMTRYLGASGFGQYTTIVTFLSFLGIAADLGLTLVTARMISQPGVDEDSVIGNLLALRTVTALIFLGIGPFLVFLFPYPIAIKIGVLITAWSFFFTAMNQVLIGVFQKHLQMARVSLAEVVGRLVLLAGVIMTPYFSWGLSGLLWSTVISGAVNFSWLYFSAHKFVKTSFIFDIDVWKKIWQICWPMAITIIFNLIYFKADTLILSLLKSDTEVGVYGAAYKTIEVLTTIPFMFAGIILPIISASWAKNNQIEFHKVLQKSIDFMLILALPLIIGTQFLANDIMKLVAGDEFISSGPILRILIIAAGIIFIGCMFAHAVVAIDKQKKIILAYVLTSVTSVAGYLYFIPKFSYYGAAWMTVYSEVVIALASAVLVWKTSKFIFGFSLFFKSLAATMVMAMFLYLIHDYFHLGLWISVLVAIVVYFVFLYLFRGITKNDILDLLNK